MSLQVKCYPKGIYEENTYLIEDDATGFKAIIDPGYYDAEVRMDIQNNAYLKYMLLTHAHQDHFSAAKHYLDEFMSLKYVAPEKEKALLERYQCPMPTHWVKDGDVISLGETEIRVVETPGHTAGGVCFVTDEYVFSGDTLFRLSVGRSDLETGDWDTLVTSIKERLYTLDENLVVYPGHGLPTSIGYEKKANPFV